MLLKKLSFFILFLLALNISNAQQRKEIRIPDIPGYITLKGDFHTHTVFSDGTVWPNIRVAEAWLDGLDILAITDHIEYRPHKNDITADHNRSYDIAKLAADKQGIILIKGAEITRGMPPGHLNALFIEDANLLEKDDVFDAVREARNQGAFILWNHPGWKAQQPDTTLWWEEHTKLYNSGLMQGIEVFNSNEYYPEAMGWAIEKNLAVFANSDIHTPIPMTYSDNKQRPMTLVFAKERAEASVKEALFAKRTVAYFDNTLAGPEQYLLPLFYGSIKIEPKTLGLKNKATASVLFTNNSDIDYELELAQPAAGCTCPAKFSLKAGHSFLLQLKGNSDEIERANTVSLKYFVTNCLIGRGKYLPVEFNLKNL